MITKKTFLGLLSVLICGFLNAQNTNLAISYGLGKSRLLENGQNQTFSTSATSSLINLSITRRIKSNGVFIVDIGSVNTFTDKQNVYTLTVNNSPIIKIQGRYQRQMIYTLFGIGSYWGSEKFSFIPSLQVGLGHSGKNNFRELTIGSITEADNSEYLLGRASLAYNINIGFGLFLK